MTRRATAQDVADLAGVSRSAVSLVLNGRGAGNISPAKQEAIRAAAAQLRYTPNAVALSLRSRRTRTIGVLTWPGEVGNAQVMLHEAHVTAVEQGYLLLVTDTADEPPEQVRQLAVLRDRQVDGLLVVAPEIVDHTPPEDLRTGPAVLVNARDAAGSLTSLVPDEVAAGAQAAEALLAAGHRRVGVLLGGADRLQTRLRGRGVDQAIAAAGVVPAFVEHAGPDIEAGYAVARRVLEGPDRPTGLVCAHERLALGALLAASALRLRVPDDLSLVSLEDGERLASRLVPPLTTVCRPDRRLARQAVRLLLDRLGGAPAAPDPVPPLDCPLRVRGSVAPPPPR